MRRCKPHLDLAAVERGHVQCSQRMALPDILEQRLAGAEQDRVHDDLQLIDEPGFNQVADQ